MIAETRWAGNLPAEMTSFVGRQDLCAEIRQALSESRMVTLTGVGGVGKTRLALRVAADMRGEFPHGAWFADLSGLRDTRLLVTTIATTLGVRDQSAGAEIDALTAYLADKSLLLVLDSCEHLANTCALLAEMLLPAAPGLRVLATGRHRLDLRDERVLTVPPLSLPGHGETASEATTLLVERARGHSGTPRGEAAVATSTDEDAFAAPTDEAADEAAFAALCERLDGIPLALELAAGRLADTTPERLISELDERFALLKSHARPGTAGRHALRTTVGWTHELCAPEERLLWARLSVFPGAFDLPAAQYVCSDENLSAHTVEQVLNALVAMSIVRATGDRYLMLDTIAEFGQHWLRALDEEYVLRKRHRDFYLRRAREGELAWAGVDQQEWYRRMTLDQANLRAALDFSLNTPREREAGLVLASTLWYYWIGCGAIREGRHYLDRAIDLVTTPSSARTKAMWVCGWLAAVQGDLDHAAELAETAYRDAEEHGDASATGYADQVAGLPPFLAGDTPTAIARWTRAVERHRANGERSPGLLATLPQLALAHAVAGGFAAAKAALSECVSLCDETGEQMSRSFACSVLSLVELLSGELDAAWSDGRSALRGKTAFDDVVGATMCVELLAWVASARGDAERAATLFGAARGNWRAFGMPLYASPFYETHHDHFEQLALDPLGKDRYAAAHARGMAMDLPEAINCALAEGTGSRARPFKTVPDR